MSDHDQIVAVGPGVVGDHLGGVTRQELGLQLEAALGGLAAGVLEHPPEELILLALYLAGGGGVGGELALDDERGQPAAEPLTSLTDRVMCLAGCPRVG